jgi:predicted NAD-dependent protein-ADP-ribosyltransferase YbiA (DUF1768 family)
VGRRKGDNARLGLGNTEGSRVPVSLTSASERLGCARVEMVALGASHSLAVTDAPCDNLWGGGGEAVGSWA